MLSSFVRWSHNVQYWDPGFNALFEWHRTLQWGLRRSILFRHRLLGTVLVTLPCPLPGLRQQQLQIDLQPPLHIDGHATPPRLSLPPTSSMTMQKSWHSSRSTGTSESKPSQYTSPQPGP